MLLLAGLVYFSTKYIASVLLLAMAFSAVLASCDQENGKADAVGKLYSTFDLGNVARSQANVLIY